jgi:hypothetical protein
MSPVFFNAQHSPIGAFASFTLGAKGARGGFGLEMGKPADQNVYIGLEDIEKENEFQCLPFFEAEEEKSKNFAISLSRDRPEVTLCCFADAEIDRVISPGRDQWKAGDITFTIYSPLAKAPDPDQESANILKLAYVPAVTVQIDVDNRKGQTSRRVVFGFQENDPTRALRWLEGPRSRWRGVASGATMALVSDSPNMVSAQGFSAAQILAERDPFNHRFGLGTTGLLIGTVPAGRRVSFRFAICFYREGDATTGMRSRYLYTRYFRSLAAVASYTLDNFARLSARGRGVARRVGKARLNPSRSFMLTHALHSYYGSTQLLETEKSPLWIVNEGEYRMMNTLDLTVDHLFYELDMNPWTVRNVLDWFARRYSYEDSTCLPGDNRRFPGGISFTHDMGSANHFSERERSSYEKAGLQGCFSFMTHEELVNWLICALVYGRRTGNRGWLRKRLPLFRRALESLLNRDHPKAARRDGLMSLDSSLCAGGAEITTYDSLDTSLGQARNNVYLAVKGWGVYLGMADLFERMKDPKRAEICRDQAARAARSVVKAVDDQGMLPAILNENVASRIIPAIEGLIIPYALELSEALSEEGPYGALICALKNHLGAVLRPGVCLFPDGAWKLSSTSDNSWLSKIYLCQFITERILNVTPAIPMEESDRRHAAWLVDERNHYWAWSDQMVAGIARGSRYYPRGVTAALWLS